jgi:hypothetical protein
MSSESDYKNLINKVEKVTKQKELDLSSDEDLSIAIMNLIGIEEHLFFTAEKTNKEVYYEILKEVREMRKELLKKIIKEYEGEVWCISKHLLASSMRLMEVGTKQLGKGNMDEAKGMFEKAYQLYSLFWALNLNVISSKVIKDKKIVSEKEIKEAEVNKIIVEETKEDKKEQAERKKFFVKITDAFKKAIDCCKE